MYVLLSIEPKYAEAILSGKKKYEFRRTIFKRNNIKKVYLYSNSNVRKIVGSFKIETILEGSPDKIWKECGRESGITKIDFMRYFRDSEKAYAIKIAKVHRFRNPIDPYTIIDNFYPPQSFRYITKFSRGRRNK